MKSKLLLLSILFLTGCKTFVIAPINLSWEIAEVAPYDVRCVRVGRYPRRFIRSPKRFITNYRCTHSLEMAKVRSRLNRRY